MPRSVCLIFRSKMSLAAYFLPTGTFLPVLSVISSLQLPLIVAFILGLMLSNGSLQWQLWQPNRACYSGSITKTTTLVPCHLDKFSQLVWRSHIWKYCLWVPDLQISYCSTHQQTCPVAHNSFSVVLSCQPWLSDDVLPFNLVWLQTTVNLQHAVSS